MRLRSLGLLVLLFTAGAAQQLLFYDDMSNFPTGWNRYDPNNRGQWTRSSARYYSESYSAKCYNGAYYAQWQNSSMSRRVNLTGFRTGLLTFRCWMWTEINSPGDYVRLETFDSSAGIWQQIWLAGGDARFWDSLGFLIPPAVDSIRFRFTSDDADEPEGVYVDNVLLQGYNPDVRVTAILSPLGQVDSGQAVQPHCRVYNDSALPVSYYVRCRVEPDYVDSVLVSYHAPGTARDVYFRDWVPQFRGKWAVRCSTMLGVDAVPANNWLQDSVKVAVHDLGCGLIMSPGAAIDSGYSVTPSARLFNAGTEPESLLCVMRLGSFYTDWRLGLRLDPGESLDVTFASRLVSGGRGSHVVRCSTALTGRTDGNPANDAREQELLVQVHNVGTVALVQPPTTLDSGANVIPIATVRNYGTVTEDFPCRYRIGAAYSDTQTVVGLKPDSSRQVVFAAWTAVPGTYSAACTTQLGTDLVTGNDRQQRNVLVRYLDGLVTRIIRPNHQIMPGVVTPLIEVRNCGNQSIPSLACSLRIGPGYAALQTYGALAAGRGCSLTMPAWSATAGVYRALARLMVSGDMNAENDTLGKTVTVSNTPRHDLAVTRFAFPGAQTDPGNVICRVRVLNEGNSAETNVPLRLAVDSAAGMPVFTDSQNLASIAPGEEREVAFRTWLAYAGNYELRAWVKLSSDESRSNDTARLATLVAAHDATTLDVDAPVGTIGIGYPIAPRIRVCNKGTAADSFAVAAEVRRGLTRVYLDSARVRLGVRETVDVALPSWTPADSGWHQIKTWSNLITDRDRSNDTLEGAFRVDVASVDASGLQIVEPSGVIASGPAWPRARVGNAGNVMISYWVTMVIGEEPEPQYRDSVWVSGVVPGEERSVLLPVWQARVGELAVTLRTNCQGDANASNDVVTGSVSVMAGALWMTRASLPEGDRKKNVKDGGCLTGVESTTPIVYALKGNNRCEFYSYDVVSGTWSTLDSLPAQGSSGKTKRAKKGAALATLDGMVYAVKGNNTTEFWMYNPTAREGFAWSQKPDIPVGAKNVKEGCGLVGVTFGGQGWLYLLKGSGTTEFYRYDPVAEIWETRTSAPTGVSGKAFKNGSCLAADGDQVLFALKGSYNEFFSYEAARDSWTVLTSLPMTGSGGRKKKAKDGAGIAWLPGRVYALKGGNTYEFFSYRTDSGIWRVEPDIPTGGGKRVKGGGALAACAGRIYAFKGNNTREFYLFNPGEDLLGGFQSAGLERPGHDRGVQLAVQPNPIRGNALVRFSLGSTGSVRLRLFDVQGRESRTLVSGPFGTGTWSLPIEPGRLALSGGVYVLRLETEQGVETRKVVVR